jgi:foldase protein PrsA
VVAKVNGEKIDRAMFEKRVDEETKRMAGNRVLTPIEELQIRGQVLGGLIDRALIMQAAKKEHVRVSKRDINRKVDELVAGQMAQVKAEFTAGYKGKNVDKLFKTELKKRNLTMSKVRYDIRKTIDVDGLRDQLVAEKLFKVIGDRVDKSEKAVRASFDEIKVSRITVGTDSRSEAQAKTRAEEIAGKLKSGGNFAALAREYSDDPFKKDGGAVQGFIRMGMMEPETDAAIAKLAKVSDVSAPVKTSRGYVIVKLDGRRSALPADFNKPDKKKSYMEQYAMMKGSEAQQTYFMELKKNVKVDVTDPEMKGYEALKSISSDPLVSTPEMKRAKLEAAIVQFQKAATASNNDPRVLARSYSAMAYLYDMLSKPGAFGADKALRAKYAAEKESALNAALDNGEANDLRLMRAEIYVNQGKYDKALEDLGVVSQNAYNDIAAHEQIISLCQKMKGTAKAAQQIAAERQWMTEFKKNNASAPGMAIPSR